MKSIGIDLRHGNGFLHMYTEYIVLLTKKLVLIFVFLSKLQQCLSWFKAPCLWVFVWTSKWINIYNLYQYISYISIVIMQFEVEKCSDFL